MLTPIIQRLKSVVDPAISYAIYLLLKPAFERFRTFTFNSPVLVIKAAGGLLVKTGANVCHYVVKGKNGQIATATDMAALSGTVANGAYNIFVFTVNSAGTLAATMGTAGATEAAVKWPKLNSEHAILGFIKIHVTGTGDFIGNHATSGVLDSATIFTTPSTDVQYINTVGSMFPPAVID